MNPINSGTSTERIIRSLLLCVLVDVFAMYFLYDGYVGYPRKNAEQLTKLIGLPPEQAPVPNDTVTAERGRALAETVRAGGDLGTLSGELGPPGLRQSDAAFFVGPGGWLKADLRGDMLVSARWYDGPHSEADQSIQRIIGWLLVAGGLAAMLNLIRVIMTRAQLSEAGLQVTGHRPIPFEAMTGLRHSDSSGVGVLEYTASGQSWTLRLDPYIYRQADEIARVIADRKGFALRT
jgi:hypothetical protein